MKKVWKVGLLFFFALMLFGFNSQIASAKEWYEDYTHTIDNTAHNITLTGYNGNASIVIVPGHTNIGGADYTTVLSKGVFAVNKYSDDKHLNCEKITSITLESGCKGAESLEYLFSGCKSLKSLTLNDFDTSETRKMSGMIEECSELEHLDVSMLDTSNVYDMSYMFGDCLKLKSLDVNNFNTSNVLYMIGMFSSLNTIKSLDLSAFDTSKVQDMSGMFGGCENLTSLNISGFNTKSCFTFEGMFNGCESLVSLDLSNFNTSKAENMECMFKECANLENVDLSSFNTSRVTNMEEMFTKCRSLKAADLSNFDMSQVNNAKCMFKDINENCTITLPDTFTYNIYYMSALSDVSSSVTINYQGTKSQWLALGYGHSNVICADGNLLDEHIQITDSMISFYGTDSDSEPYDVIVMHNGTVLTLYEAFVYKCKRNEDGTVDVTVTGRGIYYGQVTKRFDPDNALTMELTDDMVVVQDNLVYYDNGLSSYVPAVKVLFHNCQLNDLYYNVEFYHDYEPGSGVVVVTGKPDHFLHGTVVKSYDVAPDPDSTLDTKYIYGNMVTLPATTFAYTGEEVCPVVTVVYDGKVLTEGRDYYVVYGNNVNIGTASVTIRAWVPYGGSVVKLFTISDTVPPNNNPETPGNTPPSEGNTEETPGAAEGAANTNGNGNNTNTNGNGDNASPVIPASKPIGTEVTVDDSVYVISDTGEVKYKAPGSGAKSMKIPSSVDIDGSSYKVTSISKNAFKGSAKSITKVVIPDSVTTIEKGAFSGCNKLKSVSVNGNTLKNIGKNSFKGIKKNATITIKAKKKTTAEKLLKKINKKGGAKNARLKFKKG